MGSTMASVGENSGIESSNTALKLSIFKSIQQVCNCLEENEYLGYDSFEWDEYTIRSSTCVRDEFPWDRTPAMLESFSWRNGRSPTGKTPRVTSTLDDILQQSQKISLEPRQRCFASFRGSTNFVVSEMLQ